MSQPGKQTHSEQPHNSPDESSIEAHPKPSQAEGERQETQPGEESSKTFQVETPPKPSQAEGEPDTA